jgi:hypothetical protein
MREDVSAAIGEVKLVVVSMQAIGWVFPYAPNDDGRLAAKILYVALIADYHKIPWAKHLVNCWLNHIMLVILHHCLNGDGCHC